MAVARPTGRCCAASISLGADGDGGVPEDIRYSDLHSRISILHAPDGTMIHQRAGRRPNLWSSCNAPAGGAVLHQPVDEGHVQVGCVTRSPALVVEAPVTSSKLDISPDFLTLRCHKCRNNIRSGSNKFPLGTPLQFSINKLALSGRFFCSSTG